jgi:ABC-2 type transport system ATP-binding protein
LFDGSFSMPTELAIATHGLTKQFERQVAVNDVDLEIEVGSVYGLIGPNGAGKTTLIRLLAMVDQPTIGEIFINGERIQHGGHYPHLKQLLGYLPDNFPLYDNLTVWDYLDYFARLYQLQGKARTRRMHEVLELAQLTGKRNSRVGSLSRGMKQRLGLARTVLHQPILLLLDEPVSGLDPIARVQFREIIKALQEAGMTILISSHVLSDLAELCTTIGIMELGYLVESAPLQTLYDRLSHQQVLISTLGSVQALEQALRHYPQVQGCEPLPGEPTLRVHFSGDAEASAQLLRSLIEMGLPITNFHHTRDDLERIFLRLGHQQVS